MDELSLLRDYYESVDFQPMFDRLGADFLKFRAVKVLMSDGRFRTIRRKIADAGELKRAVLRLFDGREGTHPRKIYYYPARFLTPNVGPRSGCVGRRPGYAVADNCFLDMGGLFVFDLDDEPRRNARKLLKWLGGQGYSVKYILWSGTRGLHVAIERGLECDILSPAEREAWYLKQNGLLVDQVLDAGIKIHTCLKNPRQLFKLPLTVDSSSGYVCDFVDESELNGGWEKFLSRRRNIFHGPVSLRGNQQAMKTRNPFRGALKSIIGPLGIFRVENREGAAPGLPAPRTYLYTGFTNVVLGTKRRYAVFLRFGTQMGEAVETAERLIETYGLADIHLLDNYGSIVGISTEGVDRGRLRKILKRGSPRNLGAFMKYGRSILYGQLDYIVTVRGRDKPSSRGHLEALRQLGVPIVREPSQTMGSKRIQMISFTKRHRRGPIRGGIPIEEVGGQLNVQAS